MFRSGSLLPVMSRLLAYMDGPSAVPGLKGADVLDGTKGLAEHGHSIYPLDDGAEHPRLGCVSFPGLVGDPGRRGSGRASLPTYPQAHLPSPTEGTYLPTYVPGIRSYQRTIHGAFSTQFRPTSEQNQCVASAPVPMTTWP